MTVRAICQRSLLSKRKDGATNQLQHTGEWKTMSVCHAGVIEAELEDEEKLRS